MNKTYHLPEFNFAVERHNGSWVMACRQADSNLASTPEQVSAIYRCAVENKRRFNAGRPGQ